jgi:hypothetical protein
MMAVSPAAVWLGVWYGPGYRGEQAFYQWVPKSRAYAGVHASYWGQGFGTTVPVETVKCMFDPPNKITVILEVYRGGKTCRYPKQTWQYVRTAFDESVLLAAMRTGAVDTSSDQVKAEAAELYRILRGIADGSGRRVSPVNFLPSPLGGPGFRRVETPVWMKYAYLGLCAVMWGMGWWWIGRRERTSGH